MSNADERRKSQAQFLTSGCELEAGDISALPIDLYIISNIQAYPQYIEAHIKSGLTADIYKLNIDGRLWNLKKKREEILVKNADGQASFLNEIQRRADFENLKKINPEIYSGIIDTCYASLKHGIILSPWIDGTHIEKYTKPIFESLFNTLYHVETAGLFEYDLCRGNILLRNNSSAVIFDFGYMYRYNPLEEYNPDGLENPVFHFAERFESRSFMQYLLGIERKKSRLQVLAEYRIEKETAFGYYRKKYEWLSKNGATQAILSWVSDTLTLWEAGLANDSELEKLYALESFRSYVIDIHDDVSGKSCTPETLEKAETVLARINSDYALLKEKRFLFWGDETLLREELEKKYARMKKLAEKYIL